MQLNQGMHINFVGRRLKTKDDVKLRLFEAEIPVKNINFISVLSIILLPIAQQLSMHYKHLQPSSNFGLTIIIFFNANMFSQEWTSEYEDKREKRHSTAAKTAATTEAKKMRKVMFEKTKNIAREVGLYFIDWVIE